MQVFAQEDLNRPASQSSQAQSQLNLLDTGNIANSINVNTNLLDNIVLWGNYFVLAWTLFYSMIVMVDFFDKRVFNAIGMMVQEKAGMKAIYTALNFWVRYLVTLVPLIGYGLTRDSLIGFGFAIVTILTYILKVYIDLGDVLNIISYFEWSKNFANNVKKFLRIN